MAEDSYPLQTLLPAGTVQLYFDPESRSVTKPLAGESEDWRSLQPFLDAHKLHFIDVSQSRFKNLDFLVQHCFLRATWKTVFHGSLLLHIRIYLIPFDLPGASGRLAVRNRDEKVLLFAQKVLTSLLADTNCSATAWARCAIPSDDFVPFIPQQPDIRTLSEIYGELPSPAIEPSTFLSGTDVRTQQLLRPALYWKSPPGMRSLYTYQRRTVARMLQQELDPGVAPNPLYVPISGVKGSNKTFYLQPSDMEILSELPMCLQAKGGILCEEMGTGKTCIVLGLIMATKYQLSSPEEAQWDSPETPVLTPLALRCFPSGQFERARRAAHIQDRRVPLPSLVEMLTHFIRASPEFIRPGGYNDTLKESLPGHLWQSLVRNQPFYHAFERIPETSSPRRRQAARGPRKIYLTSATLVVVPRAILEQWNAEINKHCEGGSLRVILLDTGPKAPVMPSAQQLASEYDVVLLTHEKFAAEKSRCVPLTLYSWTHCHRSALDDCQVQYCNCHNEFTMSPLIQIRWKRLVVDEGHVSAAASNLARLCQELNVERRWIVSGTPTRNLMGLSLGQSGNPEKSNEPMDISDGEDGPSPIDYGPLVADEELGYPWDGMHRRWTRMDRDDLTKLGEMISKFIGAPQFAQDSHVFRKKVTAPLLHPKGPCFSAIQVLSQVMSQVMFRHQIQDVERELPEKLPTLREKTIALMFQPLAAKTYNVLQAGIAVNAVDSERKDQDYLFHRSRRAELRQTLENLTQTMFWKTDQTIFDIDEALVRSEEALGRASMNKAPASDIKLVEESIRVQRDAYQDELWRAAMCHEDNPFVIRGLSSALQGAWLKIDPRLFEEQAALLDSDRLCKLRDVFIRSPFASEHRLVELGLDVAAEEVRLVALYEAWQWQHKQKGKVDGRTESSKIKKVNDDAGSKAKHWELTQELSAAIKRRETGEVERPPPLSVEPIASTAGTFPSVSIGKSASSKINYILQKVLKHAARHKFLIFSAFPLSLAYVAEALQVAQVPYLPYTSGISPRARQQTVVTFETSEKYRVLLMELKLGARGLNLVTASRIIFCEPVWQGDVESQAIKRAHRIGQKCSQLKVTTLVMKGTSEEKMVTRRRALQCKSQKLPAMEEDATLSEFLQNPTFIQPENVESPDIPVLDIPLVPRYATGASHASQPTTDQTAAADIGEMDLDMSALVAIAPSHELQSDPPLKKRKMVHFG